MRRPGIEERQTDRGLQKGAFAPTYLDGAHCGRLNTATLFTAVPVEGGGVHPPTRDSGPALDLLCLRMWGKGCHSVSSGCLAAWPSFSWNAALRPLCTDAGPDLRGQEAMWRRPKGPPTQHQMPVCARRSCPDDPTVNVATRTRPDQTSREMCGPLNRTRRDN